MLSQSENPKTQLTLSNQVAPAHLVGLKAEKSGFGWFFDGSSSLLKSVSNTRFLMEARFVVKMFLECDLKWKRSFKHYFLIILKTQNSLQQYLELGNQVSPENVA